MNDKLDTLRETKTILLTTYKRNGDPVATPVSIAFDGDRAFFRTYDKAGKAKRLRNNPEVEAAPSSFGGKATGDAIHAHAVMLDGQDAKLAAKLLAKNQRVLQGTLVPAFHRLKGYRTMHYELIA